MLGLKLIATPYNIREALNAVNVPINTLSPEALIEFLLSSQDERTEDKACIGILPCHVLTSTLENVANVNEVLCYCKGGSEFLSMMHGLPLLITNDSMLRVFKKEQAVFCSIYSDLLPSCDSEFLHPNLIGACNAIGQPFFKQLKLNDIRQRLSTVLPVNEFTRKGVVALIQNTPVDKNWLYRFWEFIMTNCMDMGIHTQAIDNFISLINILDDWCLIPARVYLNKVTEEQLIQISESYRIMYEESFHPETPLKNAVAKLNLPKLATDMIPAGVVQMLNESCSRFKDALSVLKCLYCNRHNIIQAGLAPEECNAILTYFTEGLSSMMVKESETCIKKMLKTLPLFKMHLSDCIAVDMVHTVVVVPREIPIEGMEKWASNTNTILLEKNEQVRELHSYLAFVFTSPVQFYVEYLFKSWSDFPVQAIPAHLRYIRDNILSKERIAGENEPIVRALNDLPCMVVKGERMKVCKFVDPQQPVFRVFCREHQFPPKEFCKKEWRKFLLLAGIKAEVDGEMFVEFAEQIALLGRTGLSDEVKQKSRVLVDHLLSLRDNIPDSTILKKIANIKFIAPHCVDEKYQKICPQVEEGNLLINFADSISQSHEMLCWTSMTLLPKWADPNTCDGKLNEEDVQRRISPSIDRVVVHCQNICSCILTKLGDCSENKAFLNWIETLMEEQYKFLQENETTSDDLKARLSCTPIVFIPDKKIMVPAQQVVLDIATDDEIIPYLYKAPIVFGKYQKLFKVLGAFPVPSYPCFVHVLYLLKKKSKDDRLLPAELEVVKTAIVGLLKCLKKLDPNQTGTENDGQDILYLPNAKSRLMNAKSLVFSNNKTYEKRLLRAQVHIDYFPGFEALDLKERDSEQQLRKFPENHRPGLLSDIVSEKTDTSEMKEVPDVEAHQLQTFVQSNDFMQGILRLVKHSKTRRTEPFTEENERNIVDNLQNIRIQRVTGLNTFLYFKGEQIGQSKEEKSSFYKKIEGTGEGSNTFNLYFQTDAEQSCFQIIMGDMMKMIRDITDAAISSDHLHILVKLLQTQGDLRRVQSVLDEEKIDDYSLPQSIQQSLFPTPGKYVPNELHPFLNNGFSLFEVCDYRNVALELEDNDLDEQGEYYPDKQPIYIYVRIEKKIDEKTDCPELCQMYEIFNGEEITQVPAYKLYKFVRPDVETSTELVATGSVPTTSKENLSLDEAKSSVRRILLQCRKMSVEEQRRVIKRLYLQWHPDKNFGNEEFCQKVFVYLQNLIKKLQKGQLFDEDDAADDVDSTSSGSQHRTWSESRRYKWKGRRRNSSEFTFDFTRFFERMNNRARTHGNIFREFRENQRDSNRSDSWFHFSSSAAPVSDPGEGRRWLKQAEADVHAAEDSMVETQDLPAFNWVCYKCHQGSEKALKALWYIKDANNVPKRSHNLPGIAGGLGAELLRLARELHNHVGEHTRMRYPDTMDRSRIPATAYDKNDATKAIILAKDILDGVRKGF